MKRKLMAFALVFAMLASLSPAVAADEMSATPTVEEILNEYHRKAFEAQTRGETDAASTWSRRGGSTKTLEQETVDALTAAGYEAYNVTADNYETLEAELKTDFASMGLDPAGSYIVVVSSEETSSTNGARGGGSNIDQSTGDLLDGGSHFEHTHNGTTYKMRYVTVTAAEDSTLGMTSSVELFEGMTVDQMWDAMNLHMTVLSYVPIIGTAGSIYSILSAVLPEIDSTQPSALDYRGATSWTVTYLDIWDSANGAWRHCASIEYATARYFKDYTYFDPTTKQHEEIATNGIYGTVYSENYNDRDLMKSHAVLAFGYSPTSCWKDLVEFVSYEFDGEIIITHQRDWLYA